MPLHFEPRFEPLAQFTVPFKGTWRGSSIHTVPEDALFDSMNVFIRKKKLLTRPGLSLLNSTEFDGSVIGGSMVVAPTGKFLVAITKRHLYELHEDDSTWRSIYVPSAPYFMADHTDALLDICFMETSNTYRGVIASPGLPLREYVVGNNANFMVASVGTVPTAISVCVAGRRVIALSYPHTLRWSAVLTTNNWPPLAIAKLAQTNDVGICVRSLSSLSFVVYKERSIYVARAQSGSDETAFAFAEPIIVEGPASNQAVVNVNGMHMYMTKSGRIALFDGTRYPNWIADNIWFYLQDDINPALSTLIFGVYDYRFNMVVFCYPKVGHGGLLTGLVMINLPFSGADEQLQGPAVFLGTLAVPCSFASEMRFHRNIDRSVFFTSAIDDARSAIFDEDASSDINESFDCFIQTGLKSTTNAKHSFVTVETFAERQPGYGTVHLQLASSDILESELGQLHDNPEHIIDLENNPVREYLGFDVLSRFYGLRYQWSSLSRFKYAGAIVYGKGIV